jgi:hypothetical protein
MNEDQRTVATRLMSIEEAQHLSSLEGCHIRREEKQRARVWSWQTVAGAMGETISDEQVESLSRKRSAVRRG